MNTRQLDSYYTYRGAQDILNANHACLAPVNETGLRQEFDALLDEIQEHAVAQHLSGKAKSGEMHNLAAAKHLLAVHHIDPIVAISRMLERNIPELTSVVAPRARLRTPQLVLHAQAIAKQVERHADRFIRLGLAPDFIAQLLGAADAVSNLTVSRNCLGGSQVGATVGIAEKLREADVAFRALDTLVVKYGGNNPELMAQWRNARRLPTHQAPRLGDNTPRRTALANPIVPLLPSSTGPKALGAGAITGIGSDHPKWEGSPGHADRGMQESQSVVGEGLPNAALTGTVHPPAEPPTLLARVFRRIAGA